MRQKLLVIVLTIVAVFMSALCLCACKEKSESGNGGNSNAYGTYYLYENGKLDKSQFIVIDGKKWNDDDGVSGTYEISGSNIVFYANVFGSNEEAYSGTLSSGVLTIKVFGSLTTYYKEGSEPSGGGGDEPETPPDKTEFNVKFNLNYAGAAIVTRSTENKLVNYEPTRTGYDFNGWYLDSDLMQLFDTAEQVTSDDLVLYASWVETTTEEGQLSAPVVSMSEDIFTWKEIAGATGYKVLVTKTPYNEAVVDETINETSWSFPQSLEAGRYTVKIRAVGDGVTTVNSVYTSKNYSLRVLNAVSGIALDRSTSLLSWNAVDNAEEYQVYINAGFVCSQIENSLDLSNYDAGSLTVKIDAKREDWLTSTGSATINKMRLKTPEVVVSVNPETNAYILKWDSVRFADKYVLQYGDNEISVSDTTYTISSSSPVWGGQNSATFVVNAFDSSADYLISAGGRQITIEKLYRLSTEKSVNGAGSITVAGSVWSPVTVSFDLNGASGSVASQTVTTEKGLTYPSVPSRSGYIFRGWFSEKECENIYDFTAAIDHDITLYAGWHRYDTGTFIELNSGNNTISSSSSYRYTYFRALSSSQIRISYYQGSSSPTSYLMIYDATDGVVHTEEQSFKNTSSSTTYFYPTAGHVYYIRTRSSSSTNIYLAFSTYPSNTYLPNDGGRAKMDYALNNSSNNATNCVIVGNEYTLTARTTDNKYIFAGWYDGNALLSDKLSYTFTMPARNVGYTAKWVAYTVTALKNIENAGVITDYNKTIVEVGKSVTLTARANLGYDFLGWFNGETKLSNNAEYTFAMPMAEVSYTAKWQVKSEMSNYEFTSTSTTLNITGVIDKSVSQVTLPTYVTAIANDAFNECFDLTDITIPNSVTSIGSRAFYECISLTSIEIPNSVTYMGGAVFYGCSKLKSVMLSNQITSLGYIYMNSTIYGFFQKCSSLESITIPNSVTDLSRWTFSGCSSLTSVEIPSNVKSIEDRVFFMCSSLESITIPNSVTSIGSRAFYECSSLTSIEIPNSIKNIGDYAFYGCSDLTSAVFVNPNGWKYSHGGGTSISASSLSNPSSAASCLRSINLSWTRS